MPSLSDRIEHLTATAKAIRASASAIVPSEDNLAPSAIPFTRAVLDTALGDLIRDIDASELGLFTLVPAPDADVRKQPDNGTRSEISRIEFPGATPLKKQPVRREGVFKPKEYEPEVYSHAALKYLDRYQSIRRMPRARSQVVAITEQLEEIRENIKRLNETLQELAGTGVTSGPTPPITGVAEEERRITDLQNRLIELRNQKDALLRSNESKPAANPKATSELIPKSSSSPSPETHEEAFWSTPATSGRTLRFTDRLLEEDPDFAELSAMSNDSPGPPPKSVFTRLTFSGSSTNKSSHMLSEDDIFGGPGVHKGEDGDTEQNLHGQPSSAKVQPGPEHDPEPSALAAPDIEAEDNLDEENTIVLSKVSISAQENLLTSPSVDSQPQTIPSLAEAQLSPNPSSKTNKVRITPELAGITARIWTTVGDILLPGEGGEKPPRAEETLALIQSLATRSLSPSSPTSSISSCSSASGGPTPHQVNTAQLLHTLLTAPNHAMPLNQLKTAIGGTRALYACVAKKLIRIDRGGGEQMVLFDA